VEALTLNRRRKGALIKWNRRTPSAPHGAKRKKPAERRRSTTFDRRSDEWKKVYLGYVAASQAYATHPETPASVSSAILRALARLEKRLDEDSDGWPLELEA
jgi:hypothetical protein